ncbi:MAG: hypothetical protein ACO2Y2_06250 [Poseidonia sp.]
MDDKPNDDGPPQPILIQSGSVLSVEESTVVQTDDSASAQEVKSTPDGLESAIKRFETLNAQTDPGRALSYIAVVFLLGGPILAFMGLEGSMDLEEAFNTCCGGIIIGLVLALISAAQTSAYQKEVRLAYDTVKAEANVRTPPTTYSHVGIAVSLILIGLILLINVPDLFLIGLIMVGAGVVVASLGTTQNKKKSQEQVLAQAKLELERRDDR